MSRLGPAGHEHLQWPRDGSGADGGRPPPQEGTTVDTGRQLIRRCRSVRRVRVIEADAGRGSFFPDELLDVLRVPLGFAIELPP
jgi:hypothetical protein